MSPNWREPERYPIMEKIPRAWITSPPPPNPHPIPPPISLSDNPPRFLSCFHPLQLASASRAGRADGILHAQVTGQSRGRLKVPRPCHCFRFFIIQQFAPQLIDHLWSKRTVAWVRVKERKNRNRNSIQCSPLIFFIIVFFKIQRRERDRQTDKDTDRQRDREDTETERAFYLRRSKITVYLEIKFSRDKRYTMIRCLLTKNANDR